MRNDMLILLIDVGAKPGPLKNWYGNGKSVDVFDVILFLNLTKHHLCSDRLIGWNG